MSNKNDAGVYQKENGFWEYRFTIVVNGTRISKKKGTDELGNKLRTKRDAKKAREAAMVAARNEREPKKIIIRKSVAEVYEEYRAAGCIDKAYRTIQKQDSLWKNHLAERFGKRMIDDISVAEINDYLAKLYYIDGYAYSYTESFLKMFYLFFGRAYSRNYIDVDTYNKICVNKDTKIKMPKLKSEDDIDIVAFSRDELALLDKYFVGKSTETAYLLGRYCGLRINECFGLKWKNVDLKNGTIYIDRQMQYQEGLIKLVEVKSLNSRRTIYLNDFMKKYFRSLHAKMLAEAERFDGLRRQNRRTIEDLDGSFIYSTELVNCLPDGKIQTVNSMKYPTREIKSTLHIEFKYHYLRHTYGTLMAEMNTPQHLLCNQMGHGNIHVTQKYYIALSKSGIEILHNNLNNL
ncbi:MAG: tyrosine-type recombinase/integrase [Clostridia bacterium]|nr:tyrosine-type recombinase/integrase [Clostridia bacterium]